MRKRTYQVTSINETGDLQGKVFSADKPGVSEVREKLRSIAAFGAKAKPAILANIGAANTLDKNEVGAVWVDEKNQSILRVKGSFGTADFNNPGDKQIIIDILSTEEGKEETGMQTDAMGQAIDPMEGYVPEGYAGFSTAPMERLFTTCKKQSTNPWGENCAYTGI